MLYEFKKTFKCPHCGKTFTVNLIDYLEFTTCDEHGKDGMGFENQYNVDYLGNCPICEKGISITGLVCEYPEGAYNYDDLKIKK